MVEIIPAILTTDINEVREKLARAEGKCRRVQIDIIDGVFVQNRTVDPSVLEMVETDLALDFHLMTKEPALWVERAVRGGADRVIGQIEKMASQVDFVGKVQSVGLSVGLALDIETPVSDLDPTILGSLDVVLLMAYPAGFGGQPFDARVLTKIDVLNEMRARDDTPFRICVDGGETTSTIDDTHLAGADEVVIGKRIFDGDLARNIKLFQEAAHRIEK